MVQYEDVERVNDLHVRTVLVMVMVICLGLYRSLPRYLCGSSGPVRRERRRASNAGREEPSLARVVKVGYITLLTLPLRSCTRYNECTQSGLSLEHPKSR